MNKWINKQTKEAWDYHGLHMDEGDKGTSV